MQYSAHHLRDVLLPGLLLLEPSFKTYNQIIQYDSSKHVIVLSGSHSGILSREKGDVGVWRGHGPLKRPVI